MALVMAVILGSIIDEPAHADGCKAGTVQVGERREVTADAIIIHPQCAARTYQASRKALVGGTMWITGFNVQSADPVLVANEHKMMDAQMRLAGLAYADGVDFNRYNFVIGIAASTDTLTDLATRVVFDEYKNGQYSVENQVAYDSLKGRRFDELACHSNGAMICLAALENQDVKADRVVLYGPQITPESLQMWDALVRSGQVKEVQININQSDPVPPVSMLAGGSVSGGIAFFKPQSFVRAINETAPELHVRTFSCGNGVPTLACHAMAVYSTNTER